MVADKLILLHSVLRVYASNFMNLHWNACGEEFNDAHKAISTDYYELCDKYIDSTAEMIARLGVNPPNYNEVMHIIFHHNIDINQEAADSVVPKDESTGYAALLKEYADDSEYKDEFIMIDSSKLYRRIDIINYANVMLGQIKTLIENCIADEEIQAIENSGIRSDLEAMHAEFDLQHRYINKRRMM